MARFSGASMLSWRWLRNSPYRISLIAAFVAAVLLTLTAHAIVDAREDWPHFIHDLFEGWPNGLLGISIAVVTLIFVDAARDKAEQIEESLQHRLRSFTEIREEAYELLRRVTEGLSEEEMQRTVFYTTSAAPVFGLEADEDTKRRWKRLLRMRRASNAETKLLCYNWHALDGIEDSPLGRFAKKLVEGRSIASWSAACIDAWNQYEELVPSDRTGSSPAIPEIYLIDEPSFGIVYAEGPDRHAKGTIYISNSASVSGTNPERGAIAFSTEDRNWLMLIRQTFLAQAVDSARLSFPSRSKALIERDKQLYQAFEDQGREPRHVPLELLPSCGGQAVDLCVFPGVFPVTGSLDTRIMQRAIDRVVPAVATLLRSGSIAEDGTPLNTLAGIDIGAGTGILGLTLACHSEAVRRVVATDNYKPAVRNTLYNFRAAAHRSPQLRRVLDLPAGEPEPDPHDYLPHMQDTEADREEHFRKIMRGQRCVLLCDLADKIRRANDQEMMLIVFNYPAYQSPSNVFNTGGRRAGEPILAAFLDEMSSVLRPSDLILLPQTGLREPDSGHTQYVPVEKVAREHHFGSLDLEVEMPAAEHLPAGSYQPTLQVFALSKFTEGARPGRPPLLIMLNKALASSPVSEAAGHAV